MHTYRFRLETNKAIEYQLERRFMAMWRVHNICVKHAIKQLTRLRHDKEYLRLLEERKSYAKKKEPTPEEKAALKQINKQLDMVVSSCGLTKTDLEKYLKKAQKRFRKLLSSQQVQKEADRVWFGVEKVLYGSGKRLHFKKLRDMRSISGKENTNGVKFDKDSYSIDWMGLKIKCRLPKSESDVSYMLASLANDISYCEVVREMFPNGWHYYLNIYLKGTAPKKKRKIGKSTMGIDTSISMIAGISDTAIILENLAPDTKKYDREIGRLLRKMDRSKRKSNPGKYNEDGTYKKGNKDKWVFSKTYLKDRDKLKSTYRKKHEYIKQSHCILCNRLLQDSNTFIVEPISYKALQKRSKKTEREDKTTEIMKKDGTKQTIRKFKRKKRFGRSIRNKSPSMFLTILKNKCEQYGAEYQEIETAAFKASQYRHDTGKYEKVPLSQREKTINGKTVQRDLYSAFLIQNSKATLDGPNRNKCKKKFDSFARRQKRKINQMKKNGIHNRQCFGF